MGPYLKLSVAALLPALASLILYHINRKTVFGKCREWLKQLVYGTVFGALAVIGTEWGIPMNGAQVNCRDAAVLVAGLLFGAPAGIIAGIIGGVERFVAVAWGIGEYTRVACSLSTMIAGFYAAALRKLMFEDRKPGVWISLEIGIVMEVFHLTMIFVTNMSTLDKAMEVVKGCTFPMVIGNGMSVMASVLATAFVARDVKLIQKRETARITQTVQRWMLVAVTFAFLLTSGFVYRLQNAASVNNADTLLSLALEGTAADINASSDSNLLRVTHEVSRELNGNDLGEIAEKYHVAEINVVNSEGIITESSVPEYVGFDMHSGGQSAEFLCLIDDESEYVQKYGPITRDPDRSRKYAGIRYGEGFLQVGYDAEQFQGDIDAEVIGFTKYRHVGQSGYILIADAKLQPVSLPEGLGISAITELGNDMESAGPDRTIASSINGEKVYCRYCSVEGYYIISVLPESEVWRNRDMAVYINVFMEILIFAVLFAMIYMLIKRVVVNQIDRINSSLDKITNGHLDEVVDVRTNTEFASLSDDINQTVDTLKRYIDEASARIDAELELARNIQLSVLPNVFPRRPDFDIYGAMHPAREVGGDFFDLYMTGEKTLHFLIADVSGKGIPAAMFMMRAKTELKGLTETGMDLSEVFIQGNNALCEGNDVEMFVTAWQGSVDLESGLMSFVNAGHNPPLVYREGSFSFLKARRSLILAGMEDTVYRTQQVQLKPGDIVFLYTDGIPEAADSDGAFYGNERLLSAVSSGKFETMEELCRFIKSDVDSFVGDAPQFDDITMLAFRYLGQPETSSMTVSEARAEDSEKAADFVAGELSKAGCPERTIIQVNVAVDEVFSNIVKYGYPEKNGPVTVSVMTKENPKRAIVRFEDEGVPYNPLLKEDPDVSLSAEERAIGGLGIYVVKKTMDNISYMYENGHNILIIEKKF